MAKKSDSQAPEQASMFGLSAEIVGIALNNISIKDGSVSAALSGRTEVDDPRLLTPDRWLSAFLADCVRLAEGKFDELERLLRIEWAKHWERRAGIIRVHLDAEYTFGKVLDDVGERNRRAEKIAGMLAETLGVFVTANEVADWVLGDRIKVREYLLAEQLRDEGGPAHSLPMPGVLMPILPVEESEKVRRLRRAEAEVEQAQLRGDEGQAGESAA